jgi:hypothetical protein
MKNTTPAALACLAFIIFWACGPTAKVTSTKEYKDSIAIKSVHVIVVSDQETSACMNYYQRFFVDSLNRDGVKAEGTFYCCRDRKTDIKAMMDSLARGNLDFQTLLAIVMTKVVTGYGATSSRELQLVLYDVGGGRPAVWYSKGLPPRLAFKAVDLLEGPEAEPEGQMGGFFYLQLFLTEITRAAGIIIILQEIMSWYRSPIPTLGGLNLVQQRHLLL